MILTNEQNSCQDYSIIHITLYNGHNQSGVDNNRSCSQPVYRCLHVLDHHNLSLQSRAEYNSVKTNTNALFS